MMNRKLMQRVIHDGRGWLKSSAGYDSNRVMQTMSQPTRCSPHPLLVCWICMFMHVNLVLLLCYHVSILLYTSSERVSTG